MQKLRIILILIMLIASKALSAQDVYPVIITTLPDTIHESSGIEVNSPNSIWTHNDSGDLPRIFEIDTLGNLLRILNLSNVAALDIEDMTQDTDGNYYIGDFGNNLNNRQDLRIYKIPNPDSLYGDSVQPQIINFNFPDQLLFPPDSTNLNFDCEAMFHFNDSLYLFSKNRGISTYCKMYRLPDQPGNYTAQLIDSFNTVTWITSADISPSGKSMVLMSNNRIWLFTDFSGADFFCGNAIDLTMGFTQKEAIVFINNTEVYITDERFFGTGGNLYYLDLKQWIDAIQELPDRQFNVNLYPNPATDKVLIGVKCARSLSLTVNLHNAAGHLILHETYSLFTGESKIPLLLSRLQKGLYFLRIYSDNGFTYSQKLILD
jgi:hypothetical protein